MKATAFELGPRSRPGSGDVGSRQPTDQRNRARFRGLIVGSCSVGASSGKKRIAVFRPPLSRPIQSCTDLSAFFRSQLSQPDLPLRCRGDFAAAIQIPEQRGSRAAHGNFRLAYYIVSEWRRNNPNCCAPQCATGRFGLMLVGLPCIIGIHCRLHGRGGAADYKRMVLRRVTRQPQENHGP
jgi:hypothetical protein